MSGLTLDDFLVELFKEEPWRARAACIGLGPDAFFPKRGESRKPAKKICADCPVKQECDQHADEYPEEYGVWGGKIRRRGGDVTQGEGAVITPIHPFLFSEKRETQVPVGNVGAGVSPVSRDVGRPYVPKGIPARW